MSEEGVELSYGLIDSASIGNAVGALVSYSSGKEWAEWTRRSIVDVTRELALHRFMRIAPGPSRSHLIAASNDLYRCYDLACDQLGHIEDTNARDHGLVDIQRTAQRSYKSWVLANIGDAKAAIVRTKQDPGYQQWEQWAIGNAFVDHSKRLNGLFNHEMVEELSLVLNIPEDELKKLWNKTRRIKQLELWSKGKCLDSDFEVARDAFVAAAILRGRYHDEVAKRMNWWHMHHPIRRYILLPVYKANAYRISEALNCLVAITITAAMEERKTEARVGCWVENIIRLKEAFSHGRLDDTIASDALQDKAVDLAIEKAKQLEIRTYPKSLPKYIEYVLVGIIAGLTTVPGAVMLHEPWTSLVVGAAGTATGIAASVYGLTKGPLGTRVAQAFTLTDGHLLQLANSEPGRIVWVWKGIENRVSTSAELIRARLSNPEKRE